MSINKIVKEKYFKCLENHFLYNIETFDESVAFGAFLEDNNLTKAEGSELLWLKVMIIEKKEKDNE